MTQQQLPQQWRFCALLLLLALLLNACTLAAAEPGAPVRSLVTLPLPTVGAEEITGPVVALVSPPTPTPASIPAAATGEQLINFGEQIYATNCATCHQPDGEGQGAYPALNGNPFVTAEDATQVIATVLQGRGQMPAFQDTLSSQEIAAVVSYIRNAWSNNASAVSVEQVERVAGEG